MKTKYIQYYVEGQCEDKLINTLKTDFQLIKPGKTQVFNVMDKVFSRAQLMTLKSGTGVVLIYDTDVINMDIFTSNIQLLEASKNVSEIILIPQNANFEDELSRALGLKSLKSLYMLFYAEGCKEFKNSFINTTNIAEKLKKEGFKLEKMWSREAPEEMKPYNINKSGYIML